MNYYRRYIGDFQRDTGHLSLAETGAYDRLLDHYYATEAMLPGSLEVLCRIARAVTKDERAAVQSVADQFFPLSNGVRSNKRADKEIATSKKARDNGAKGGRPVTEPETGSITGGETGLVTGEGGGSGHPPTTNHQPLILQPPEKSKGNVGLAPDAARQGKNFELRKQAAQIIKFLNEKAERNFDLNGANADHVIARLKDGETVDDCRAVIAMKCRQWKGDPEMAEYLRPETLFNRKKFASYKGALLVV